MGESEVKGEELTVLIKGVEGEEGEKKRGCFQVEISR